MFMRKIAKLFFSITVLSASVVSVSSCAAMTLTKFNKDIVEVFKDASSFLLSIVGGIVLLMLVFGGILYIFAGSNPEAQNKAKGTVTKAIIGLVFVLVSYGIINQTSQVATNGLSTSLPICYWECSEWLVCVAGSQTRVCAESCGATTGSPVLVRSCVDVSLIASFDWSHKVLPTALPAGGANWMTSVKNQSTCGSCWAFSTLGYMEAIYNIENGNPALDINLSEQDLISCSAGSCSGWSLPETANYIQNTGVVPQACFLYSASNEACSVPNKCVTWVTQLWKIAKWSVSTSSNQQSIKEEIVNNGPVLAGMNMNTWNPISSSCTSSTENHGVIIVGYDDLGGYWIVKNSHGSGWDGDGYFEVKYGQCGLDSGMTVTVENVLSP